MVKKAPNAENLNTMRIASDIVAAYVRGNTIETDKLPSLIRDVHSAVSDFRDNGTALRANKKPAVEIKKSITPDYLICLEDGNKLKMLKRYLRTHYNLSPEEYRRKWNLPADYPMVAPQYSKRRSQYAKQIGLGLPTTQLKQKTKKNKRT